MLEAKDLWKAYGATTAVAGVSLTVGPGEIVGLLGPNGAGKSTTVAMLCGLTTPDRGTVHVGGAAIAEDAGMAKRRLGLVPQEVALYEDLNALSNVRLFGALYGVTGSVLGGPFGLRPQVVPVRLLPAEVALRQFDHQRTDRLGHLLQVGHREPQVMNVAGRNLSRHGTLAPRAGQAQQCRSGLVPFVVSGVQLDLARSGPR